MEYILYAEINFLSTFILVILYTKLKTIKNNNVSRHRSFEYALLMGMLFFLSDGIWGVMDGQKSEFPRWSYILVNQIYFLTLAGISYFWLMYIESLKIIKKKKTIVRRILENVPITIVALLLIVNSWNGCVFRISDGNEYSRGPLVWIIFLVIYIYLFASAFEAVWGIFLERNYERKNSYAILSFVALPMMCGIVQIAIDNIAFHCVGITIAAVQVYMFIIANEEEDSTKEYMAVIEALGYGYTSYTIIDWDTDKCTYQYTEYDEVKQLTQAMMSCQTYSEAMLTMYKDIVNPEDVEKVKYNLSPEVIRDELTRNRKYDVIMRRRIAGFGEYVQFSHVLINDQGDKKRFVVVTRNVDELVNLQKMTYTDSLTGVNNRNGLNVHLEGGLEKLNESDNLYIHVIDADNFKGINDTYGHNMGDRALVMFAGIMKELAEQCDGFVTRYGGDEFVLLGHYSDENAAQAVSDQINTRLEAGTPCQEIPCRLSASVGYAKYSGGTFEELFDRADEMLYEVKNKKKLER